MATVPGFLNPPPWTNQDLVLYHGTLDIHSHSIRTRIDPSRGSPETDFGQGFYTTTFRRQARVWAWQLAQDYNDRVPAPIRPVRPVIVRFSLSREAIAGLRCLAFVRNDFDAKDFWSFVHHCRDTRPGHGRLVPPARSDYYDVVIGPVAAVWRTSLAISNVDQISFHTHRGARLLDRSLTGIARVI